MRINHKILSIPPYISTSWKQVLSLKTEKKDNSFLLHIHLQDGSFISIPEIDESLINAIFTSHSKYLENETIPPISPPSSASFFMELPKESLSFISPPPFLHLLQEFKGLSSLIQHDIKKSNDPSFPQEMINKIVEATKSMKIENPKDLPKAEPHCNCPRCQISRYMNLAFKPIENDMDIDEEVKKEDLSFKDWIIYPIENNQYKVIHPDRKEELHLVNLNSPVMCSCGSSCCEHILAVLNT